MPNEKRLIDANALSKSIKEGSGTELQKFFADVCVATAPTVDAAEVVHGRWYVSEYEYLNCSVCGEAMYTGCNSNREANLLKDHWKNYCPNCGAKMDGGK